MVNLKDGTNKRLITTTSGSSQRFPTKVKVPRDTTWISTKWTLSLIERCYFTDYSVHSIKIDR